MTTTAPPLAATGTTSAVVIYDGQCPLCRRSVAALRKLDWFNRITFQDAREVEKVPILEPPLDPQRLLEEMHLVTPNRQRVHAGFFAFRWLAWRLPLLLPLAPFLYLPGVPWLGRKVYLWIARNRFQLVPCDQGECRLPGR